jgi:hypothetical protein
MPLKLKYIGNDIYTAELENVISFWNILKYLVDAPYLKHYLVENYEGGNTLVSREAWEEDGVMFKEISPNLFFFPYESVGFVLDDSVHNIDLTVIDQYTPGVDYKKENDLVLSVKNTDTAVIELTVKKLGILAALYLLSFIKTGFDRVFLLSAASTLDSVINERVKQIEYIKSSFKVTFKGINFVIRLINENRETFFYKINYFNKKCRKENLKENKIRSITYLKKKIINKNRYLAALYYFLVACIVAVLFLFGKKFLLILAILGILAYFITMIVRKNAYRFFS